ncbi:MAG: hypothetical protein ABR961_02920 [Thermoanaerobaculaceae bacterium]
MRKVAVPMLLLLWSGAPVVCGQGTSAITTAVAATAPSSPLDAVRFLVGTWQGDGSGQPGQGSGSVSFALDLDGHVLVRRSHSEYPATAGRPPVAHEDLMVIYPAPGRGGLAAVYFDNEGHVIPYSVDVSKDGKTIVFQSEPESSQPRFRLTCTRVAEDVVDVAFEIAPPGTPAAFKPYVSGRTRRTGH